MSFGKRMDKSFPWVNMISPSTTGSIFQSDLRGEFNVYVKLVLHQCCFPLVLKITWFRGRDTVHINKLCWETCLGKIMVTMFPIPIVWTILISGFVKEALQSSSCKIVIANILRVNVNSSLIMHTTQINRDR